MLEHHQEDILGWVQTYADQPRTAAGKLPVSLLEERQGTIPQKPASHQVRQAVTRQDLPLQLHEGKNPPLVEHAFQQVPRPSQRNGRKEARGGDLPALRKGSTHQPLILEPSQRRSP